MKTKARGPAGIRESKAARRERARAVIERLGEAYPDATCALHHENAFQLLVATILSAQCTDARVNQVTPALFARYGTAEELAGARQEELEALIRSTGFYRNKTKSLLGMAAALVERHGGEVPAEMEALVKLPGVGRKTANVVLSNAFGKAEGVVVDTHVKRLAGRLGFTRETDPVRIERDLMDVFPREHWGDVEHLLIFHGRAVCKAQRPRCGECVVAELCPVGRRLRRRPG
ncbi:MAG TPA: endonuclease III [Longimicrobiales bacterium]